MHRCKTYPLNSCEGLENEIPRGFVGDLIARDIIRNVEKELGKEGDFKYFIEGNQSQVGKTVLADLCWRRRVGKRTKRLLFNLFKLVRTRVGKPIW